MKRSVVVGPLTGALVVALATVGYASTQGGDQPVSSDPGTVVSEPSWQDPEKPSTGPPSAAPTREPESTVVTPRPGMVGVHPVRWERAEPLDAWTVRIHFYSGVEPCSVLDSVTVGYEGHEVRIALFEGSDPTATNVACIDIALLKAVDVRLDQPIAGRRIVDAASR